MEMKINDIKICFTNGVKLSHVQFLISIFVILFSILTLVIVSINNLSFQYVPIHWAFVEASMHLDHMTILETSGFQFDFIDLYPGYYMFLLLIERITNISIKILEFLPITGFIITLIYYLLAKKMLKSKLVALVLTVATIPLDLIFSINLNSLNSYSLTIILFLSFLYLYFRYIKSENKTKKINYILLLFLLFIGSFFMHHRAPVWEILLLLVGNIILFFNVFFLKNKNTKKYITHHLAFALIVIYFTFNKVIYEQYIPKASELSRILGFYTLEDILHSLFANPSTHVEKYMFSNSPIAFHSVEYNVISIIKWILILIPSCIFLFINLKTSFNKIKINRRSIGLGPEILLFYTLLSIFFIEIFAYFILGRVSLVYYVLIFPLLAAFSIKNFSLSSIRKRRIITTFIIILLFLSVAKFVLIKQENFSTPTISYKDVGYSSNWLINRTTDTPVLITDLYIFGKYLVEGSSKGVFFKWDYYTQHLYKDIVENGNLSKDRYLVINEKDYEYPIVSLFWQYFEPLFLYRQELNNNVHLNKIYDDTMIEIYHTL